MSALTRRGFLGLLAGLPFIGPLLGSTATKSCRTTRYVFAVEARNSDTGEIGRFLFSDIPVEGWPTIGEHWGDRGIATAYEFASYGDFLNPTFRADA